MELNAKKIKNQKTMVLKSLGLSISMIKEFLLLLSYYRYVDEINQFRYGSYIRWIRKDEPEKLTKGMFLCDIIIGDEGVYIKGRIFPNRFLNVSINDCIFFQKMTTQELIILKALNQTDENIS